MACDCNDLKLGADDALLCRRVWSGRVTRFDLTGRVLARYGTIGTGLDNLRRRGYAGDSKKNIYVADPGTAARELQTQ